MAAAREAATGTTTAHQVLQITCGTDAHGEVSSQVETSPEAWRKVLEGLPPNTPVRLILVFGPQRTGKSFICNHMAGRSDMFLVSDSYEACTKGVHAGLSAEGVWHGVEGAVLVLDAEGSGGKTATHAAQVAMSLMPLASIIIFNTTSRFAPSALLEGLSPFMHIHGKLTEAQGATVAHPTLGHLLILSRDAANMNQAGGHIVAFGDQSQGMAASLLGLEGGTDPAAAQRDADRKLLAGNCASVSHFAMSHAEYAPEHFEREVALLSGIVKETLQKPHYVMGQADCQLTAETLPGSAADMVQAVCDTLEGTIPMSPLDGMRTRTANAAVEVATSRMSEVLSQVLLPMVQDFASRMGKLRGGSKLMEPQDPANMDVLAGAMAAAAQDSHMEASRPHRAQMAPMIAWLLKVDPECARLVESATQSCQAISDPSTRSSTLASISTGMESAEAKARAAVREAKQAAEDGLTAHLMQLHNTALSAAAAAASEEMEAFVKCLMGLASTASSAEPQQCGDPAKEAPTDTSCGSFEVIQKHEESVRSVLSVDSALEPAGGLAHEAVRALSGCDDHSLHEAIIASLTYDAVESSLKHFRESISCKQDMLTKVLQEQAAAVSGEREAAVRETVEKLQRESIADAQRVQEQMAAAEARHAKQLAEISAQMKRLTEKPQPPPKDSGCWLM